MITHKHAITVTALLLLVAATALPAGLSEQPSRTITVTGEGTVETVPDIATVRIGVESVDRDIQEALSESRSVISSIVDSLMSLGVAEKDMQTANYSFNFDRSPPELGSSRSGGQPAYRVNNTLTVTIRNLDLTGQIIDAAVLAGANEMWGVTFSVQEPEPLVLEATGLAVTAAKERAEYLASLNDLSVGKLLSMSESTATPAYYTMERGLGGGGGIHPGVVSYSVRLTAVYELSE